MAERSSAPLIRRVSPTPLPSLPPVRRLVGFPAVLPPLIGRERELGDVLDRLRQQDLRLLTLTGPGGVGKTRLALAAAMDASSEFADGVAFIPLAAVGDPALTLPTIANALDVREPFGRSLADTLADALNHRRALLVLDNLEHLLACATDLVALLNRCPGVTMLVTSRAPLGLGIEQRLATPPLSLPPLGQNSATLNLEVYDAVAMFAARAQAVQPSFALDSRNAEAVQDICRQLDGLPLAIELAAAWVRVLPPEALLRRLGQRLPLLHGGAPEQPARLRTMRDAIAWSYNLLSASEAALFRRLALFTGGFTLEAAEWVAATFDLPTSDLQPPPPDSVLDLIAALVDKSLLQVQPTGADSRFQMLETVREFAMEQLAASEEGAAVAAAHAAYIADLVERAEPDLLGPQEQRWRTRLDAELGNIRAALDWSLEHGAETALRIAAPLWVYWSWNRIPEGKRWTAQALAHAPAAPSRVRLSALLTHAALATLEGDFAAGQISAQIAIAHAAQTGEPVLEGLARWIAASAHIYTEAFEPAVQDLDRALALLRQAQTPKDRTQAAYARWTRGHVAYVTGDPERGAAFVEGSLAQVRETGSAAVAIIFLGDYAGWLLDAGDTQRARNVLNEALALGANFEGSFVLVGPLPCLALLEAMVGNTEAATRILGALERLSAMVGVVMPTQHQRRIARATDLAKAALGEPAFAAAWAAGHADALSTIAAVAAAPDRSMADASSNGFSPDLAGLSRREREVLVLMAAGHSDREIASALFISYRTATHHVRAVLAKMDARSRAEAAVRAVRAGLI